MLSRKLQKRLTRRTLAEAKALKEQGTECIHVLLYVVELVSLYNVLYNIPVTNYITKDNVRAEIRHY